jgi:signal transduction histidine kinase
MQDPHPKHSLVKQQILHSPRFWMALIATISLILASAAVMLALIQPAFDVQFSLVNEKIILKQTSDTTPSLPDENLIVSMLDDFPADPLLLLREPDHLPNYEIFNLFMSQQAAVFKTIQDGILFVKSQDGSKIAVNVRERHLSDLPAGFWIQLSAGSLALLISGGIWSFRRYLVSAQAFLACGVGFALVCDTLAVYSLRELVMAPDVFLWLHQTNRFAVTLLTFSGVALFWYFPQRLNRFPIIPALAILGGSIWLNETLQWWTWPIHAYQAQFFIVSSLGMMVGVAQWRNTRQHPLERAALRWLLLSFLIFFTGIMLLYVMPTVLALDTQLNLEIASLIVLSIFCGIALGISRYRLFELERWWLEAWLWFICGLLVVVVDVIFVSVLDMSLSSSLTLTILLVGWLYFPIRQWALRRLGIDRKQSLQNLLPHIFKFMLSPHSAADQNAFWKNLLTMAFQPLHSTQESSTIAGTKISDHGLILLVPGVASSDHIELAGCMRGQRLFNHDDVDLVEQMHSLISYGNEQYEKRRAATARERDRIMRDLHDDVSAKLLTLIHRSSDEYAAVARSALASLRDTIYSLQPNTQMPVQNMLDDLRAECMDRCAAAGITLTWNVSLANEVNLDAHQQINTSRIVREALTNALKHAGARLIQLTAIQSNAELTIHVEDDGATQQWDPRSGNGLINMRRRCDELAGTLDVSIRSPHGVKVSFTFPLDMTDAINLST